MKNGLAVGDQQTLRFIVDEGMVAAFEGKTVHRVLSTFHLVYYAELTARKLIEPFLEDYEDAAGSEIFLRHIAPTKVGDSVVVEARLKGIEGRKIICEISASNSSGPISAGTQTQMLIERGELERL